MYNELLDMMFAEEGLVLTDEDRLKYHEEIIKEEPQKFDSLDSCERVPCNSLSVLNSSC